jgi:hypothetical protein
MPYGISAYGQSPQIGSPLQHTGSLIQQHMVGSGATAIYAGSESNGSPAAAAVVSSTALQTTSSTSSLFRTGDEKRLTREAMERYLRDRNDMIIVVLHAKVITDVCCWRQPRRQWKSLFVCSHTLDCCWLNNNCWGSQASFWFSNFFSLFFSIIRAQIISGKYSRAREFIFYLLVLHKFPHQQSFSFYYIANEKLFT